jgi:enamine deaminase RidA (YjgF/YER057c/UK114 family)
MPATTTLLFRQRTRVMCNPLQGARAAPASQQIGEIVREEIDPPELFRHPAYKRVVTVSGDMKLVFIAGQTPSDENYRCVAPGDYKGQWLKVMENLDLQLRAAGATWDDVVFRRIFVRDVDAYFEAVADPALPRYGDGRPPSTLIGVTRLSDPEFLIEVDLMAVVSP